MGSRFALFAMVMLGLMQFSIKKGTKACTTFQLNHEGQIFVKYQVMVNEALVRHQFQI